MNWFSKFSKKPAKESVREAASEALRQYDKTFKDLARYDREGADALSR